MLVNYDVPVELWPFNLQSDVNLKTFFSNIFSNIACHISDENSEIDRSRYEVLTFRRNTRTVRLIWHSVFYFSQDKGKDPSLSYFFESMLFLD